MRAEARLTLEFYRELRAFRPRLRALRRTLKRYTELTGDPLDHVSGWINTGLNLTHAADPVLEGTRAGRRARAEARVIADHLVNTERKRDKRTTSTMAGLLEIASGGKPARDEDDFEKSRKRWDEALRLARTSPRGTELADYMEAMSAGNDLASR